MYISVRSILKFSLGGIAVLYPLLVFLSFVVFDVSALYLSIFIIVFSILYLLINLTSEEKNLSVQIFINPAVLLIIGITGIILNNEAAMRFIPIFPGGTKSVIKIYPLLVNAAWFVVFMSSLFFPPNFVYKIASLFDKSIRNPDIKPCIIKFSRRSTVVWCVFFALDTIIAWFTIFAPQFIHLKNEHTADVIWGIYNGAVTYIAMGVITIIQIITAKRIIKKQRTA
ncbi:MAG: hypothetical protein Pg6A_19050 [Termitinemataceae bacterium]|jgi:uncharacterized membrane protein|nr:MAG: hypothetical protein Pg6A_19050 [Termitinemataceae bacterium]